MPGSRVTRSALAAAVIGATLLAAPAARADRAPTAEEAARIEAVLRENGYTAWGEVEFDDGVFEVDDVIATDGKEYDLKLDESFLIVDRDPD
ncbi:PepSY domain-containing protein [Microbaculum marinum]|uniref:PepSY domain-containing protein n=1 Tax=Microbaculum marinum TaxID=1764581 RepID=A0AAW9RXG7_9HYPH